VAVEVALLPSLVRDVEKKVCVVIDVLRASTTLSVMAQAGFASVFITPDPPSARRAAKTLSNQALLGGESGGIKPDDFDLGNSPDDYRDPGLRGRTIVFCSSNGARALHGLSAAPVLLVGAPVNARAAAERVLSAAREHGLDICLVCAGEGHGTQFSLEDTFGAGLIVSRLMETASDGGIATDDAATAALRLHQSYRAKGTATAVDEKLAAEAMFDQSEAAHFLRSLGLADDVRSCGDVDSIDEVMRVDETTPLLRLRSA
jgi:2-phosphosulfolactate phosphatase